MADREFGLQTTSLPIAQHTVKHDHFSQVAPEPGGPLLGTAQGHTMFGSHLNIGQDRGTHRIAAPHLLGRFAVEPETGARGPGSLLASDDQDIGLVIKNLG